MSFSSISSSRGFTLIEVMIVVVVLAILAGIAIPSYQQHVMRANRTEGQALLNEAAARQERYYAQNNKYITADADVGKLSLRSTSSETGKYTLSIGGGGGGYTLTANQQFNDAKCGDLTLNAKGERGRSGTGLSVEDCWK